MGAVYHFDDLTLVSLSDGVLRSSADYLLDVTEAETRALCTLPEDRSLFIPVNSFFFRRDDAHVLIDAGTGNSMQPSLGRLPSSLRQHDIAPEHITHIILTHIHPDHANGLIDDELMPTFPNASLIVHKTELDYWMREDDATTSDHVRQRRARNKQNLRPYHDRIIALEGRVSILGCSPQLAPGHTPGHACWWVEAGRTQLAAWGDTVHFSDVQFARPDIVVKYDIDPAQARSSRLKLMAEICARGTPILGAHVTAPGVGHLEAEASGYRFVPLAPNQIV